jgi:hypothetical protein
MRPLHPHLPRLVHHAGEVLQHVTHGHDGQVLFGAAVVLLILIWISGWHNQPGR